MGEYPALSETDIKAIKVQIDRLTDRQGMFLRHVTVTINHPAI